MFFGKHIGFEASYGFGVLGDPDLLSLRTRTRDPGVAAVLSIPSCVSSVTAYGYLSAASLVWDFICSSGCLFVIFYKGAMSQLEGANR